APHDGAAMAQGVREAKQAGIPVIAYDRLITDCDLDLYMTFDNVRVGELQAQFLVDQFLPKGIHPRIIRVYGAKTDHNVTLFKQGQDNVLNPLIAEGKVTVIHEDWAADWKPENAKKIVNAAITQNGKNFDAVLACNDGTAGGAIQALLEEGMAGKVVVVGQDAELAACQRIINGTQAMTIYKPLNQLAQKAATIAMKMARHEVVVAPNEIYNGYKEVPAIFLDVYAVTQSNMRETVIRDGLHSEDLVYRKSP
ncbi:MAG TPA: substrate-binding domain-containing protein, partial [Opitutales bacterium]|nr:substrate-binding domain-containing protein [Opitutales bacterium]